mgnify:CR=1 FL=1
MRVAPTVERWRYTETLDYVLREMTSPRRLRNLLTKAMVTGQEDTLNNTSGEVFPSAGTWVTEVPEWASRARVLARWKSRSSGRSRTFPRS